MTSTNDSFDKKLLVNEIRDLPCIWDYTLPAYNDRDERTKAWDYICAVFHDYFISRNKTNKKECVRIVQKQWKHLSINYKKQLKIANKNSSNDYDQFFFEDLSFLRKLYDENGKPIKVQNNNGTNGVTETTTQPNQEVTNRKAKKKNKKTKENQATINATSRLSDVPNSPLDSENCTDSDKHFLLSLHDKFKLIDSDLKIQAQIEILSVLQKYNRSRTLEE